MEKTQKMKKWKISIQKLKYKKNAGQIDLEGGGGRVPKNPLKIEGVLHSPIPLG